MAAKKGSQKGKQIQVCVSLPPELVERVKQLTVETGVPMARYFRDALEGLIEQRATGTKKPRTIGGDAGEYVGRAFSPIELLVAASVMEAALAEGKKHFDREALKRVLARLKVGYEWKSRNATAY